MKPTLLLIRRIKVLTLGLMVTTILLIFSLSAVRGQTPDSALTSPNAPTTNSSTPPVDAKELKTPPPAFFGLFDQDKATYQVWNFHGQNTDIIQGDPSFPAKYSAANSLDSRGEITETVTVDLFAGVRLWSGAEFHVDGLMWQGFGLSDTFGIEAYPNGDAYKAGTHEPNYSFAHLFVRQTIGLGGEQEQIPDGQLTLAGKEDISRLTFTIGRMSPLDIFDTNAYADDQHTQFMNWAMMGNLTWDYGQDTIGYTTGATVELNQKDWALRYGFFQMPREKNAFTGDDRYLMIPARGSYGPIDRSWAMSAEFERRFSINDHPGKVRLLAWLDEADFASYQDATAYLTANPPGPGAAGGSGADIPDSVRGYHLKYGFGLNLEQEVVKDVGVFSRLGWNNGQYDTWTFTDADWSASMGTSINGDLWGRPDDTIGVAGILSGASSANQRFLEAGGEDMLDGDGQLSYGIEKVTETYYDCKVCGNAHVAFDYQFVDNPAFNRDRGPVSIFGARFHWEF